MTEPAKDCFPVGPRKNCVGWVLCAAVLVFALGLRIPGMGRPVWIDEALTLDWAGQPAGKIIRGNVAPLMPLIAKAVLAVFQSESVADEVLVRAPHLLFGLAGIGVVFLFLWRFSGLVSASVAGLFLATLPKHIAYSQDARYYALSFLAAMLFLFFSREYVRKPSFGILCCVGCAALAAAMNHLSAFLALPAVVAGAVPLIFWRREAECGARLRSTLVYVLVVGAACAAPFALNMSVNGTERIAGFLSVFEAGDTGSAAEPGDAPPVSEKKVYRLSPGQYFRNFAWSGFVQVDGRFAGLFFFLTLMAGVAGLFMRDRSLLFLLACLFFLPPLPGFLISTGHFWVERYFVAGMGVIAILAGCGTCVLVDLGRRAMRGLPGGERTAAAVIIALGVLTPACNRADYGANPHGSLTDVGQRSIARHVAGNAAQNDSVVFFMARPGWSPARIFKYYIGRYSGARPSVWRSLRYEHINDYENLRRLSRVLEEKNLWVVTEASPPLSGFPRQFLDDGFVLAHTTPESLLWVRGAPTTNILSGGDFELNSPPVEFPPEAQFVDGVEGFLGSRSLRITVAPEIPPPDRPIPTVWFPPPFWGAEAGPPREGDLYALSFVLKCADVTPGENPKRTIRVILAGRGFFADYLIIDGTHDWQRYEVVLRAGKDFPLNVPDLKIGIGNRGGSGTFWLDNVQLEKRPRSTPFTRDTRAAYNPSPQN